MDRRLWFWSQKDGDYHRRQGKENFFSECKSRNGGGAFEPFRGLPPFADSCKREEEKPAAVFPDQSLQSPAIRNHRVSGCASRAVGNVPEMTPATVGAHVSLQSLQQQPPRKARRCWSQELHRRFMLAIQQLGGVQGEKTMFAISYKTKPLILESVKVPKHLMRNKALKSKNHFFFFFLLGFDSCTH